MTDLQSIDHWINSNDSRPGYNRVLLRLHPIFSPSITLPVVKCFTHAIVIVEFIVVHNHTWLLSYSKQYLIINMHLMPELTGFINLPWINIPTGILPMLSVSAKLTLLIITLSYYSRSSSPFLPKPQVLLLTLYFCKVLIITSPKLLYIGISRFIYNPPKNFFCFIIVIIDDDIITSRL